MVFDHCWGGIYDSGLRMKVWDADLCCMYGHTLPCPALPFLSHRQLSFSGRAWPAYGLEVRGLGLRVS